MFIIHKAYNLLSGNTSLMCRFNETPGKLFCGYHQTDCEVYMENKRPSIVNEMLNKKNKVGELILPLFMI